jgi:hypothetical protein
MKSQEHEYGLAPLPWHSPNSRVWSGEIQRFLNFPFTTSARPFLAASALGAAESTYDSSIEIMVVLPEKNGANYQGCAHRFQVS